MALKQYQQDTISEMIAIADELVTMQRRIERFAEIVANAGLGGVIQADLDALPAFEHLTMAELTAALTAANAVATAINGQRAVLIKALQR